MPYIPSKYNKFSLLLISAFSLLLLASCGTSRQATTRILKPISASKLIKKIESEVPDYKDYACKKVTVNLDTNGDKQSVTAQFKIKRDDFMIITLRKMTVPLGRAFVSDDSVAIINYYDKNYVSGSVEAMQKVFKMEQIDFHLLQALFTADVNSILENDFKEKEFVSTIDGQLYKLESLYDRKIEKALENNDTKRMDRYFRKMDEGEFLNYVLWIDPEFFVVRKVVLNNLKDASVLTLTYDDFTLINRSLFPQEIVLDYSSDKQKTTAQLSLYKPTVNEEDNWDFSIPSKYDKFDAASFK